MIGIEKISLDSTGILGTSVKVTVIVEEAMSGLEVSLTVENPLDGDSLTDQEMIAIDDRVYQYVWQSADSGTVQDEAGTYEAIVTVYDGTDRVIGYQRFDLTDVID